MENLQYLLSAYFHQDWNHTHDSWQRVIDEFLTDDSATVVRVPEEIDRLVEQTPDDGDLQEKLIELGCAYDPPEGDRTWLLEVRDRIRRTVNT